MESHSSSQRHIYATEIVILKKAFDRGSERDFLGRILNTDQIRSTISVLFASQICHQINQIGFQYTQQHDIVMLDSFQVANGIVATRADEVINMKLSWVV